MGVVIVILLNVLIAQLSYTYSEAKKMAKLQYAADTMRIVTRLEYSRYANWVGKTFYKMWYIFIYLLNSTLLTQPAGVHYS